MHGTTENTSLGPYYSCKSQSTKSFINWRLGGLGDIGHLSASRYQNSCYHMYMPSSCFLPVKTDEIFQQIHVHSTHQARSWSFKLWSSENCTVPSAHARYHPKFLKGHMQWLPLEFLTGMLALLVNKSSVSREITATWYPFHELWCCNPVVSSCRSYSLLGTLGFNQSKWQQLLFTCHCELSIIPAFKKSNCSLQLYITCGLPGTQSYIHMC